MEEDESTRDTRGEESGKREREVVLRTCCPKL